MKHIGQGKIQITYGLDKMTNNYRLRLYFGKDTDYKGDMWQMQDYWYLIIRIWKFYFRARIKTKQYTFGDFVLRHI